RRSAASQPRTRAGSSGRADAARARADASARHLDARGGSPPQRARRRRGRPSPRDPARAVLDDVRLGVGAVRLRLAFALPDAERAVEPPVAFVVALEPERRRDLPDAAPLV